MVHIEESQHRNACEYFQRNCEVAGTDEMSQADVGQVLRELGYVPNEDNIRKTLKLFDKDGSGTISLEEFLELMYYFRQQEKKQMLEFNGFSREEVQIYKELFDDYDKDKS